MRAYFVLLVAATALLTYGRATATYSPSKGEMNLTGTVENDRPTRSLRVAPSGGNGEERSWSTIKGIPRSKAETVRDWLTPQLNQRRNVQTFARDVGITSRQAATQHQNWDALVKYLKMYNYAVKGEKMSKSMAESVLLNNVLTAKNNF